MAALKTVVTEQNVEEFLRSVEPEERRDDGLALLKIMEKAPDSEELLGKLGKHKAGGGCLYIKRLEDVDQGVLAKLIKSAYVSKKKASQT